MKRIFFLIVIFGFIISWHHFVFAQGTEIYFFYSNICLRCAREEIFLDGLKEKYPEVNIRKYEIHTPKNQEIWQNFQEEYQVPQRERIFVPATFVAQKYFVGFNEQIAGEIEDSLKVSFDEIDKKESLEKINLPLIGKVDLSQLSLPVLAVTLGALDGLNPCAMWVLLFLIALLLGTKSRKRMWLIGGTFLAVSGLVYYLILTAWLNLFLAIGYVNFTRILIGVFAVGAGIWQIKNFIRYKPGLCKVTDGRSGRMDKLKEKLKNYTARIAFSPLTLGVLVGVAGLALAVNLIEFFCSAGIPAIFTRILAINQLGFLSYHFYLLLYTFVFILDDLIILSLAVITLSRFRFTEKYNYWATLIGGILILILGILMIFKPEILMFG